MKPWRGDTSTAATSRPLRRGPRRSRSTSSSGISGTGPMYRPRGEPQAAGVTAAVQKAQRVAFVGMSLRHSGQGCVVGPSAGFARRDSTTSIGLTTMK